VVLREGFEASLVLGIVLSFLNRTGRRDAFLPVWIGAAAAVGISIAVGVLLVLVGKELEGRSEMLWEGVTMLTAAALLTWMIFWMRRQSRRLRHDLEGQVARALAGGSALALALVAFVGVLREGVETALLVFGSFEGANVLLSSIGSAIGLAVACGLGYLFYRGSARLDLRRFFTITSTLLLLFAGYLLAGGLHELGEAGVLPESEPLLVAAFLLLAVPTLVAYYRSPAPAKA
jgi:high-affinity iron transporter